MALTDLSLENGHVDRVGEPLLLERGQGPVGLEGGDGLVHAADQGVALREEHAELLRRATGLLELADDRALRDLCGRQVERSRKVGHDRVDLAVDQGLLGVVGALEHHGVAVRLDLVADRGQRGGAGLGAELVLLEVGQAGRTRRWGALERDHALRGVVVAVGEVDHLGTVRA